MPESNLIPAALSDLPVSHIGEYFGAWAIHEETFRATVDRLTGFDLRAHVQSSLATGNIVAARDAQMVGMASATSDKKLAIVSIDGPMMKYASSLSGGTSTVAIRKQLRELSRDDSVAGVMLKIFSPGGTVSGNQDLADDVAALARVKPVHAFIEDLGASAAYWIASQCDRISTTATSLVGSIGTFAVITDSSGAAEQLGFKVHVVKAGDFKGAGQPGTEVSKEMLKEFQRNVDALNEHFLQAVAAGRSMSMSKVKELADGRVHVGAEAVGLGLADAVSTFDQAMNELANAVNQKSSQSRKKNMAENVTPVAATLTELKAAFPNAGSDFVLGQLEAAATMDQARHAFEIHQRDAEIAKLKAENEAAINRAFSAELDAKKANEKPKAHGFDPVPIGGKAGAAASGGEGGAIAQWNAAIEEKIGPRVNRQQAAVMVAKENPALQAAYIEEYRQQASQRA